MPDPEPRPSATVLLVRDAEDGVEVLMVERPAQAAFGGLMVFPGGAVEECDFIPDSPFADVEFRVAGMRETAEEVGFVPTRDGFDPNHGLRGADLLARWESLGTVPAYDRMTLVSRWVTPRGRPARFDTRFYLIAIEGEPEVVLDRGELVGYTWATPARALEEGRQGRWKLILPTWSHLRWLDRWGTVDQAVEAARGADGGTVIEPVIMGGRPEVRYRPAPVTA